MTITPVPLVRYGVVDYASNNRSNIYSRHCGSACDATDRTRISDAMEHDRNHVFRVRLSFVDSEDGQLSQMEQGGSQVWVWELMHLN